MTDLATVFSFGGMSAAILYFKERGLTDVHSGIQKGKTFCSTWRENVKNYHQKAKDARESANKALKERKLKHDMKRMFDHANKRLRAAAAPVVNVYYHEETK